MKKFLLFLLVFVTMFGTVYAASFDDVKGQSCESAVDFVSTLGIVNGTGDGKYEPNKSVTRAELAKMIVLTMKLNADNVQDTFLDVYGHWGRQYILSAANNKILNGYTDGTFKPDNKVTYAETIAIIMRCLGYTGLEQNVSGKWYENYIFKMAELNIDEGVEKFENEAYANRGDVAIFLKNMIMCNDRANSEKSLFDEKFAEIVIWEDLQVKSIFAYGGHVWFETSAGSFYMDENIDLGNLGAFVSGYYNKNTRALKNIQFSDKVETKRITGSAKKISERGYEVFNAGNTYGYGDPVYAEYVDVFVNVKTDEVERVVYYDTSENHFAEKVKLGTDVVSIESKDVYDESIVQLNDGRLITFYILRHESVMEMPRTALVMYDGKVITWESVPLNSIITEIRKDNLYQCYNKFVEGSLDDSTQNVTKLKIDGVWYDVNENAICQNVVTEETAKIVEGLDYKDIQQISKNDKEVKIYLNQFNEIVKLEFKYDIWKVHVNETREEKREKIQEYMNSIGFVESTFDKVVGEEFEHSIGVQSEPKKVNNTYKDEKFAFEIGDFVYAFTEETKNGNVKKVEKVTSKKQIGSGELLVNYMYEITGDKMGIYYIDENTEFIEVVLSRAAENKEKYESCTMEYIKREDLKEIKQYSNVCVIVDEDGFIVRMYVVKVVGSVYNYGIVKEIRNTYSGDEYISSEILVRNHNDNVYRYNAKYYNEYHSGDLVSYTIKTKEKNEKRDTFVFNEVYKHENIGSKKDLIVDRIKNRTVTFENSDFVLELTDDSFIYENTIFNFEDFTFINAKVEFDDKNDSWIFKSLDLVNKNKLSIKNTSRVVINELTSTIIVYDGFKE